MKLTIESALALLGGLVTVLGLFGKYLSSLLLKKKEDTELIFKVNNLERDVKELKHNQEKFQETSELVARLEERLKKS